jgi:cell shape-determining protein MreC
MLAAEDISRLKLSIEKAKEAQILIDSLEQMTDQLRSLMWEIDSDTDE